MFSSSNSAYSEDRIEKEGFNKRQRRTSFINKLLIKKGSLFVVNEKDPDIKALQRSKADWLYTVRVLFYTVRDSKTVRGFILFLLWNHNQAEAKTDERTRGMAQEGYHELLLRGKLNMWDDDVWVSCAFTK